MKFKTRAELHNTGFVMLDSGYIVRRKDQSCEVTNPTPYFHYENMDEEEIKRRIAFDLYEDGNVADGWEIYASDKTLVIKYISRNGDLCVGAFYKLSDKFSGSSFIREEDKEFVEKIVARIDCDGKEIKLGDIVSFKNKFGSGRVVWLESGFHIYDDSKDEHITEVSYDAPIIKLN